MDAMSNFIDDIAVDDDGDDEEDDEEDDGSDAGDVLDDETLIEDDGAQARRLDLERETAEAAAIREKTQRFEEMGAEYENAGRPGIVMEDVSELDRQSLLPTHADPKLWMVKCKTGMERKLVLALMYKFADKQSRGKRMGITSVICRDNLRGYFFVEARREDTVKAAISGLRGVRQSSVTILPLKEMVDTLEVTAQDVTLRKDAWVRMKRGQYRGDLARIVRLDDSGSRAVVKLIPRLDLDKHSRASLPRTDDSSKKRKRPARPAAKFFSPEEVQDKVGHLAIKTVVTVSGEKGYMFGGNEFVDGYLVKSVPINSLNSTNVVPTLEEFQKFQNMGTGKSTDAIADALAATLPGGGQMMGMEGFASAQRVDFQKGDMVQVVAGELTSLKGSVLAVDGESVTFVPNHIDFSEPLTIARANCAKYFNVGDHVRVTRGLREGETGHIVAVDSQYAHVFSDLNHSEFKVFVRDVRLASAMVTTIDTLGEYEVYDLVELDATSVGVVIQIEGSSLRVLNQNGVVSTVRPTEVGKKWTRRSITLDSAGNNVGVRDVIRVLDGPHKGKQGTVKHIFRAHIFAHSASVMEHGGMFAVRGRNCVLLGGAMGAAAASYTTPAPASYTTPAPGPAPMDVAYTSAAPAPAATPLPAFARPGVVVTVNNEQGVISHTLPDGTADVRFSSGRVATVAGSDMAAVHPASNGDRVMMVDSGMTGTITSMDDVGVLVSFGDDVRMVDNLSMLVRVE
ncbi:transcription elongation factor SPT5 [Thecamonas trahens ATCC 50062]|uniref:Transcription elongation factor SPT5 n=1 Tax=Thecamonas trahens ATCC 50062 TaxID=461836 RepID=A0A0L0DWS7_THETB|nr:transcription elongation factor SPT5 [Thecamonas trahens ATCC 50062]KNC55993.1 transcription elongation factor SPT5 [Thecamonas trahens ATCC 50062]|eukprot:XP_013761039.1 transcription elongation factor SPT5 [Thecamonas trahens ATCC 50062]